MLSGCRTALSGLRWSAVLNLDAVGIALSDWLTPSSHTVSCVEHDVLHNKHNMYS